MTRDYGSADPKANQAAPVTSAKGEGPEDDVGFGADSAAPRARADRGSRARKSVAANPLATYAKGGRIRRREDGGPTGSGTKYPNKITDEQIDANNAARQRLPQPQSSQSGQNALSDMALKQANDAYNTPSKRAAGGRTKAKGKGTNVNVIVAPQGGHPMPPPVLPVGGPPPGAPVMPPRPPMPPMGAAGPMGPSGPAAGLPMAPGAPGGMPPGIMPPRAKGGRVKRAEGGDVEPERTLKNEGLTRSDKAQKMGIEGRAKGGKIMSIHDMDAGAVSGPGRLEKAELQRNVGKEKVQTV